MRSSISSSSERAPAGPWGRTWWVAAVICLSILGSAELLWRAYGMRPTVTDTTELWAAERARLDGQDTQRMVVLLGASRMQLGFSHAKFHERYPNRPLVNLSVAGQRPMASLADIAQNTSFRGTVLVSATAESISARMDEQREWVQRYQRGFRLNAWLNSRIAAAVQSHLVITNSGVNLLDLLKRWLWQQGLPRPNHYITLTDRSRQADFQRVDIDEHRRLRVAAVRAGEGHAPDPEAWLARTQWVETWVEAIMARGGKVVFIRFPTADEHWDLDRAHYPRSEYWDRWANRSKAAFLHFMDVPEMQKFELPDTSHLDERDAPAFTESLLRELAARDLL